MRKTWNAWEKRLADQILAKIILKIILAYFTKTVSG
jgi:hypothetical protein